MKSRNLGKNWMLLAIALPILSLAACASKERLVTYEETEVSDGVAESKTVYIHKEPNRRSVEKQVVREKVKCVGKNGQIIKANTPEQCIKLKGKVIDEVTVEEEVTRRK